MRADPMFPVIERVAAICEEALSGADPRPFVAIGGSTVEKPFMCHVGELPQNVQVVDPASSTSSLGGRAKGLYRLEWSVAVTMWADRKDLVATSRAITAWWSAIARAVAADRTLGGLVHHAQPYWSTGWTSRNQAGTYLVAVEGGVSVRQDIDPLC